jgi:hypothetical protein
MLLAVGQREGVRGKNTIAISFPWRMGFETASCVAGSECPLMTNSSWIGQQLTGDRFGDITAN